MNRARETSPTHLTILTRDRCNLEGLESPQWKVAADATRFPCLSSVLYLIPCLLLRPIVAT